MLRVSLVAPLAGSMGGGTDVGVLLGFQRCRHKLQFVAEMQGTSHSCIMI